MAGEKRIKSMAAKSCSPVAACDCCSVANVHDTIYSVNVKELGVTRYLRDMPPPHYTLKIDSYSDFLQSLSKTSQTCYTSQIFEASGYKWKLSFYRNGDEERNGGEYISMFLTIEDTKSLPVGWEVNVNFKFFVFDHIRNKYLSIQDSYGRISRFDARKTEYGISQLLPLCDFNDSEKGYLNKDKCILGAEICVVPCTHAGECISPVEKFEPYSYKWEVSPFSSFITEQVYSDVFTAGNFKWKLFYYPKGCKSGEGNSLSLFLKPVDLNVSDRVYAEYKLCIHDQGSTELKELTVLSHWFTGPSDIGFGHAKMVSFSELYNPSNGFLVKDKVIFEVQITKMITVQSLF